MNLKKVHHIAIIGSNYEKSKHFYVDLLGFSIIRENYRPERDDYKIDLQLDEIELELFIIKNCPKRPSYPEAYGLRHLAFAVDSVDDTVRELNKRGIITEPIRLDTYTGIPRSLSNPYEGSKQKVTFDPRQVYDFQLEKTLDEKVLLKQLGKAIDAGQKRSIEVDVSNTDRAFGTILGSEITRKLGDDVEEDTYHVLCKGAGGQSLGAFCSPRA